MSKGLLYFANVTKPSYSVEAGGETREGAPKQNSENIETVVQHTSIWVEFVMGKSLMPEGHIKDEDHEKWESSQYIFCRLKKGKGAGTWY
jgi:hypothetical protein